jgi:hypothetical protein
VAENQPAAPGAAEENRMTNQLTFSSFATRLREFIQRSSPLPATAPDAVGLDLQIEFSELALALFRLQFENNPAYRRFCETRGATPESARDWTGLPAMPTAVFKELDVTCLAPAVRTHVFLSSGTTGQRPGRHFHNAESRSLYEASLRPWFAKHLLADQPGRMKMLFLSPPAALAPNSSLAHMFDCVRRELGSPGSVFMGQLDESGAWALDLKATLAALREAVASGEPLIVLGTAFNFVHLLDSLTAESGPVPLPFGSRVMETGGYKGRSRSLPKAALHALITERLAVPPDHIVCEYGMSELSSQAYDLKVEGAAFRFSAATAEPVTLADSRARFPLTPFGAPLLQRVFHFPPWARAQIISPETGHDVADGETGLIRVVDLANVYSVMAIQTEDLGVRRGDGFELIGRAPQVEPRGCSLLSA